MVQLNAWADDSARSARVISLKRRSAVCRASRASSQDSNVASDKL